MTEQERIIEYINENVIEISQIELSTIVDFVISERNKAQIEVLEELLDHKNNPFPEDDTHIVARDILSKLRK
jgi:hypothetical protein